MTLRLVVEHAPNPQPRTEVSHAGGDLTIGRGAECDWQIDDPDMIVSRRHCMVSLRDGQYLITDSSRGGVFLDGAAAPLGAGNTARLEDGMRIRLGDVVLRAEIVEAEPQARPQATDRDLPPLSFEEDDFFRKPIASVVQPKRPENSPVPFGTARGGPAPGRMTEPPVRPKPAAHPDDPFLAESLSRVVVRATDLSPSPRPTEDARPAARSGPEEPARVDPFGLSFAPSFTPTAAPAADQLAPPSEPAPGRDWRGDDSRPPELPPAPPAAPPPAPLVLAPAPAAAPIAAAPRPAEASRAPAADQDLRAAFLRGLGLSPADFPSAGTDAEDMEALGRRFRLMTEGLVQMLRTRAKEKGSVRVAQTVIGSADVNPLKFLATDDEILGALVKQRGKGYLPPEEAIAAAFRDLSDHQVRTWIGLQSALRHMIDRFDPLAFEREADTAGTLKSILSGGRGARLWQLYSARYREIAKSAEDRFLGDVGADFRDAYDAKGRNE